MDLVMLPAGGGSDGGPASVNRRVMPVTMSEVSLGQKNMVGPTMSVGSQKRPMGMRAKKSLRYSASENSFSFMGVVNRGGRDGVHAHPVFGPSNGKHLGHLGDPALAGGIGNPLEKAHQPEGGADVDDLALAPF